MKKSYYATVLLAASLTGCHHDADSPSPNTLLGSWRLTAVQCYCPAGQPLKDETITFDSNQHFQLFRNGQLATEGTYATGPGTSCGIGQQAILSLSGSVPAVYVPYGVYSVQDRTLIIDNCSVADGPKYTYTRQ